MIRSCAVVRCKAIRATGAQRQPNDCNKFQSIELTTNQAAGSSNLSGRATPILTDYMVRGVSSGDGRSLGSLVPID